MRRMAIVLAAGASLLLAAGCATTVAGSPQAGPAAASAGADTSSTPSPSTGPAGSTVPVPTSATGEIRPVPATSGSGPQPDIPVTGLPTVRIAVTPGTPPPASAPTSEQPPPTSAPAPPPATAGSPTPVSSPTTRASTDDSRPVTTASPTSAPNTPVDQPATVDGHDSPWNRGGFAVFHSPSGNISCMMGDLAGDGIVMAMCEIGHHSYPAPARPAGCNLDYGDRFVLGSVGKATLGCHGDTVADPSAAVLPYGTSINYGSLACTSSESGMWCGSLDTGHYFKVASAAYQLG